MERQIATYGVTGIPILESCILQSGGRYRGLFVRKARKHHGSLKLIEGRIDPDEPTILIDDSISSGMSMEEGCRILEDAGLRVEGGIALVRFGWYGGYAVMQERGYHVAAIYDIWEDFMTRMEGEEVALRNPSKWFPDFAWSPSLRARGIASRASRSRGLARVLAVGPAAAAAGAPGWTLRFGRRGLGQHPVSTRTSISAMPATDSGIFPAKTAWSAAEDIVRACLRTAARAAARRRRHQADRRQQHRGHVLLRARRMFGRTARQRQVRNRRVQPREARRGWAALCRECPASAMSGSSSNTPDGRTASSCPSSLSLSIVIR